jgi:ribosome recycling factor
MEQHELIKKLHTNLDKVMEVVAGDMATIRTGKAKPDLVSGIEVMAYGQRMKLFELASVTAPDANLIVISPWDKGVIGEIEKAIRISELALMPSVSGDVIRINIPALTTERRSDFVKLLHQKTESGKVMARQARQEIKEEIDRLKGKPGVSEDDIDRLLEELQKVLDIYMGKIEEMGRKKEEEIMVI